MFRSIWAWIKDFVWSIRKFYDFCQGQHDYLFWRYLFVKAARHANSMAQWKKLTPDQRERWYASGNGRVLRYD